MYYDDNNKYYYYFYILYVHLYEMYENIFR